MDNNSAANAPYKMNVVDVSVAQAKLFTPTEVQHFPVMDVLSLEINSSKLIITLLILPSKRKSK